MKTALELLKPFNPCCPEYLEDKTPREAWDRCENGAWMLWAYRRLHPENIREITLAKGYIAATILHMMKDERSRKAVEVAIAFGEGRATREELDAAAYDAAAAYAAYAAYADTADTAAYVEAASAAYAAAYAAACYVADTAARAAYVEAASAAYAAACYVADTAARAAARAADVAYDSALKQSADICRKYLTETMFP